MRRRIPQARARWLMPCLLGLSACSVPDRQLSAGGGTSGQGGVEATDTLTTGGDGPGGHGGVGTSSGAGGGSASEHVIWTACLGAPLGDEGRIHVADVETIGTDVYVAGSFSGKAEIFGQILTANGLKTDAFLLKTDESGVLEWLLRFGGTEDEEITAIDASPSGDALAIVGHAASAEVSLPEVPCSPGPCALDGVNANGLFAAVVTPNGAMSWIRWMSDWGPDCGADRQTYAVVATSDTMSATVTCDQRTKLGVFRATLTDGAPLDFAGGSLFTGALPPIFDIEYECFGIDTAQVWPLAIAHTGADVVVSGAINGVLGFGTLSTTPLCSKGGKDAFAAVMPERGPSTRGDQVHKSQWSPDAEENDEEVLAMEFDETSGRLAMVGRFLGCGFGACTEDGPANAFVAAAQIPVAIDPKGSPGPAWQISAVDDGPQEAVAVAVKDGEWAVAGWYFEKATFASKDMQTLVPLIGEGEDAFLLRIDGASGQVLGHLTWGGPGAQRATAVATDLQGSVLIAGDAPSPPSGCDTTAPNGAFVLKWLP